MAKTPANSGEPWTGPEEAALRREAAGNTPTRVIALHLQRTEAAIRRRASDEPTAGMNQRETAEAIDRHRGCRSSRRTRAPTAP